MAPNTPPIRECDATYPCSHFTWDTNLSYRQSQFKKIRGWVCPKRQKKLMYYENLLFFMIYDFMAPNTPPIRECDATYPCLHFT